MAWPVVSVASGGIAVVEVTSGGVPVTEAANLRGQSVTKMTGGKPGLPVVFVSATGGAVTPAFAAWDPASAHNVTLSGSNLIATGIGGSLQDQGVTNTAAGKTTGKYYYEMTYTAITGTVWFAVGTVAATYTNISNSATNGAGLVGSGLMYVNATFSGSNLGARANGDVIGIAVDLDNRKIWFRVAPAGTWNASGTANPAANVGGFTVLAGTICPFVAFSTSAANQVAAANFGATAFTGAVPSGFTAGWPA